VLIFLGVWGREKGQNRGRVRSRIQRLGRELHGFR
jgi:hypothetical protein